MGEEDYADLLESGAEQGNSSLGSCLVRKFWTDKSFNIKTFMNTIRRVWNLKKEVDINELGKKLFFNFRLRKINKEFLTTNLRILISIFLYLKKYQGMNNPHLLNFYTFPFELRLMTYC